MPERRTEDAALLFASGSLIEHAVRGVIGFGAFALAVGVGARADGWWPLPLALVLTVVALIALRGCPICWAIGLAATLRGARR